MKTDFLWDNACLEKYLKDRPNIYIIKRYVYFISVSLYLCISVSLYLCISVSLSVAVSGERVQIKNWLDFHFWYWLTDFVFEFSSIEIVVLTFKCELKKDANYISIFILATNKLKLLLLFKQSLAVIKLATLTERCIMLEDLWYQNFLLP